MRHLIELNLRFRDYLRTNPDVRDEYAALKLSILGDETAHQRVGKLSFPVYTLRKSAFISKIIKDTVFNRLRVLKCITEDEWKAVKKFRKNYFHRLGISDPIRENFEDENHEHFLLYRGTEIIGYADIRIFSKSSAMLCVFESHSKNESLWFIDL
ncbi:MAG: GrpB family protein, partial [Puniceicoccales bacterium]|nr:GrpB family protein [Puniceicoccales bacterium]